ncbi:MAG: citrate/2-methylcitrate synthase [Candidatus Omnitrophica bacterium]|nr:citrate/2-methylcitrate synthase [Candidatus Omnitrophota bacterium]
MGNRVIIQKLADKCVANNRISPSLYQTYNVKRGLRNEDGSGVLVGLTEISTVIGFEKRDEDIHPVEGQLEYRGVNIKDIVNGLTTEDRFGFEEVAYLLLFGELPTKSELKEFGKYFAHERHLPGNFVRDIILTFRTPDVMNSLARSVLALYSVDENPDDTSLPNLVRQAISLIAKFPVITAYAYHARQHKFIGESLFIHQPLDELSTAENFLHMLRPDGKFTKLEAQVLDIMLILHADHGGGNNSTFTTRVVSSSGTDTYSAISAAIGSLKGPLHGGANKSVMSMMEDMKNNVHPWNNKAKLKDHLVKIIKGEAADKSGKVYGFGHAVYTRSDPRAILLKEFAIKLAKQKKREKELVLYLAMEELVPEVFGEIKGSKKVISPNVDFFSGFVYDCLGIPTEVYTPLFAVARIAGWMAHRIEELMVSPRIIRPAYKNVTVHREYVSLSSRKRGQVSAKIEAKKDIKKV